MSRSHSSSARRSSAAESLPRPVSVSSSGKPGRCGDVMRMTSAPCAASVRPHTGPAMTRVRSSTRMSDSGRSPGGRQRAGGGLADAGDLEQRQLRHRAPLRVRRPFRRRTHHGGDQLGVGGRRLEFLALPLGKCGLHGLALVGAGEQLQHAGAVVREVGVQAHVAPIAGAIDAGDLVPGGPRRLAVEAHVALAAELDRRRAHVDRDGLGAPGPRAPDLGRRQPRRRDRRLRRSADAERGRQHRLGAGQRDALQRRRLAAGHGPQVGEDLRGRGAVSRIDAHAGENSTRQPRRVIPGMPDLGVRADSHTPGANCLNRRR